jgi:hypothetical protein
VQAGSVGEVFLREKFSFQDCELHLQLNYLPTWRERISSSYFRPGKEWEPDNIMVIGIVGAFRNELLSPKNDAALSTTSRA